MPEEIDALPTTRPRGSGRPPATRETFVPDLVEHGAPVRGEPQTLETRLFVQLQVFTGCLDTARVVEAVRDSGLEAAVYANLNDPRGVGVLLMSEDPTLFAETGRALLKSLEIAIAKHPAAACSRAGRMWTPCARGSFG